MADGLTATNQLRTLKPDTSTDLPHETLLVECSVLVSSSAKLILAVPEGVADRGDGHGAV